MGKEIVEQFAATGVKVAVLDCRTPLVAESVPFVRYFQCDVSDPAQVREQHLQIKQSLGKPTVLVNNAGVATGKPLQQLSFADVDRVLKVNLLLSFYTIMVFLPDMVDMKRGYVINIGSTLGYMSPAALSSYGASKAGLVALHELLTYELGPPLRNSSGVKTLLVCPGQMKTAMFTGVDTPNSLLAPELEPLYVARKIIDALELGRRGELKFPFYGHILPVFRAMPWPVAELARNFSGIDQSMRSFRENVKESVLKLGSSRNTSEIASVAAVSPKKPSSAVTI